ncbi:MAG: formylglycine-generating enzyme family protein [Anaerolineales bacterium]
MKKLIPVITVLVLLLTACGGGAAQPTAISLPTAAPTTVSIATQATTGGKAGDVKTSNADAMQMAYIPSGTFYMGGVDTDAKSMEKPAHNVTVSAFWMDKLEVTNGMYTLCTKAGKCTPPRAFNSATRKSYFGNPDFNDFPVINVSWGDASAYCAWAGRRLPTEAEWEYAARGSTDYRRYPWGDPSPNNNLANYDYGVRDTSKVGSYPAGASPFGILDMAGNVWEWVADFYDPNYYAGQASQNPTGPSVAVGQGLRRVIRGGSWVDSFRDIRVSARGYASSPDLSADSKSSKYLGDANDHIGFRCAANAGN